MLPDNLKQEVVGFLEDLANSRSGSRLTRTWQFKDPSSRQQAAEAIRKEAAKLLSKLKDNSSIKK